MHHCRVRLPLLLVGLLGSLAQQAERQHALKPEYMFARMEMVVSTPPRTKAIDPLFSEQVSAEQQTFEISLQRDIRDALARRRAGRIDVRNISFRGLHPFLYDGPDVSAESNVTAAKAVVEVLWSSSSYSVDDVSDAIMVRFMPNGTKVPSECGIDMDFGINVLSNFVQCTDGDRYEEDHGHCCPRDHWTVECETPCVLPLVAEFRKEQDSRGCYVGKQCVNCVDRPLRRHKHKASEEGDMFRLTLDSTSAVAALLGGLIVLAVVLVLAVASARLCTWCKRQQHEAQLKKEAAEREGEWLLDDGTWDSSDDEEEIHGYGKVRQESAAVAPLRNQPTAGAVALTGGAPGPTNEP